MDWIIIQCVISNYTMGLGPRTLLRYNYYASCIGNIGITLSTWKKTTAASNHISSAAWYLNKLSMNFRSFWDTHIFKGNEYSTASVNASIIDYIHTDGLLMPSAYDSKLDNRKFKQDRGASEVEAIISGGCGVKFTSNSLLEIKQSTFWGMLNWINP